MGVECACDSRRKHCFAYAGISAGYNVTEDHAMYSFMVAARQSSICEICC